MFQEESVYLWHDTEAKEVSQEMFYNLRYGGGTRCSSALRLMKKLIAPKSKYDPSKWNIYAFYFGDGENELNDNSFDKYKTEYFYHQSPNLIVNNILSKSVLQEYFKLAEKNEK